MQNEEVSFKPSVFGVDLCIYQFFRFLPAFQCICTLNEKNNGSPTILFQQKVDFLAYMEYFKKMTLSWLAAILTGSGPFFDLSPSFNRFVIPKNPRV